MKIEDIKMKGNKKQLKKTFHDDDTLKLGG